MPGDASSPGHGAATWTGKAGTGKPRRRTTCHARTTAADRGPGEGLRLIRDEEFTSRFLEVGQPEIDELIGTKGRDEILGEPVRLDSVAGGWRPQLHEWATGMFDRFWRHPWALETLLTEATTPAPSHPRIDGSLSG